MAGRRRPPAPLAHAAAASGAIIPQSWLSWWCRDAPSANVMINERTNNFNQTYSEWPSVVNHRRVCPQPRPARVPFCHAAVRLMQVRSEGQRPSGPWKGWYTGRLTNLILGSAEILVRRTLGNADRLGVRSCRGRDQPIPPTVPLAPGQKAIPPQGRWCATDRGCQRTESPDRPQTRVPSVHRASASRSDSSSGRFERAQP
jgi:hypothetical protein